MKLSKKLLSLMLFLFFNSIVFSQSSSQISTLDFVEILNENRSEAIYYYQNNWMLLRKNAVKRGFISSFQLLEVPYSKEAPFHLILITTYKDEKQYQLREENFEILIKEANGLQLLNEKKPVAFRKTIFSKERVKQLK